MSHEHDKAQQPENALQVTESDVAFIGALQQEFAFIANRNPDQRTQATEIARTCSAKFGSFGQMERAGESIDTKRLLLSVMALGAAKTHNQGYEMSERVKECKTLSPAEQQTIMDVGFRTWKLRDQGMPEASVAMKTQDEVSGRLALAQQEAERTGEPVSPAFELALIAYERGVCSAAPQLQQSNRLVRAMEQQMAHGVPGKEAT